MMDFMVQIVLSLLVWWAQLFDDRELGAVVHRERSSHYKRIRNPEGFFVATADHGLAERRGYGNGFFHGVVKAVQVGLASDDLVGSAVPIELVDSDIIYQHLARTSP